MTRPALGGRFLVLMATVIISTVACSDTVDPPVTDDETASTATSPPMSSAGPPPTTVAAPSTTTPPTTAAAPGVVIALRFDRRTTDPGTEGFEEAARTILTDDRGWQQAGFRFEFRDDAPYTVMLGEPSEVDAACRPYEVGGQYSCQIGPLVALNADRWRSATETWPGAIEEYRAMLVNHEVGHLLGLHHPAVRCPGAGQPAPVMAQQSKGLEGCAPNPWPLPWEISCAARHEEPIAPPYDLAASPLCGPADA